MPRAGLLHDRAVALQRRGPEPADRTGPGQPLLPVGATGRRRGAVQGLRRFGNINLRRRNVKSVTI